MLPIRPAGNGPADNSGKKFVSSRFDEGTRSAKNAFAYIDAIAKGYDSVSINGQEVKIDKESDHVKLILEILKNKDNDKIGALNLALKLDRLPEGLDQKHISTGVEVKLALTRYNDAQDTARENAGRARLDFDRSVVYRPSSAHSIGFGFGINGDGVRLIYIKDKREVTIFSQDGPTT